MAFNRVDVARTYFDEIRKVVAPSLQMRDHFREQVRVCCLGVRALLCVHVHERV